MRNGLPLNGQLELVVSVDNGTVGCAVLEVQANDPLRPNLRALITSERSVRRTLCTDAPDDRIAFPEALVGTTKVATLRLFVCADAADTTIDTIELEGFDAPFNFVEAPQLPRTLVAGEILEIPIAMTGFAAGLALGAITFVSEAGLQRLRVSLQGSVVDGSGCQAVIEPHILPFLTTVVGSTASLALSIANLGGTPCYLDGYTTSNGPLAVAGANDDLDVVATYAPVVASAQDTQLFTFVFNNGAVVTTVRLDGDSREAGGCNLIIESSGAFATSPPGTGASRTLLVRNAGPGTCFVGAPHVVDGDDAFRVILNSEPSDFVSVGEAPPFSRGFNVQHKSAARTRASSSCRSSASTRLSPACFVCRCSPTPSRRA